MVPRVACLVVILVTEVSRLLSSRFGETSVRLGDEKTIVAVSMGS